MIAASRRLNRLCRAGVRGRGAGAAAGKRISCKTAAASPSPTKTPPTPPTPPSASPGPSSPLTPLPWPSSSPNRKALRLLHSTSSSSSCSLSSSTTTTPGATAASPSPSGESYVEFRRQEFEELGIEGLGMYGRFSTTHSLREFIEAFKDIPDGSRETGTEIRVAGRVISKRLSGKKTAFYHIQCGVDANLSYPTPKLQILCERMYLEPDMEAKFGALNKTVKVGDVIGIVGFPGKSNRGELSIVPRELKILAPCLHTLPEELIDPNIRSRERYRDLLVNPSGLNKFVVRSKVISAVGDFLRDKGFLNVETPTLWPKHGGANARPFETVLNAKGKLPLRLRVAPELFLKQLLVAGFDRVFEIGKVFRNEGIDATHNPEFTVCEFYQAYAEYRDLMPLTESLLHHVLSEVFPERDGKFLLSPGNSDSIEIDFSVPFKTLEIVPALELALGIPEKTLPNLNCISSLPELKELSLQKGIDITHIDEKGNDDAQWACLARVVDKLIAKLLEPQCVAPTFLLNHPLILSPLASSLPPEDPAALRAGNTEVVGRFEFFIGGRELANAYTELSDPQEQRRRFSLQEAAQRGGDEEAAPSDEDFCRALEHGIPPCAGYGLGIDRLVMFLTGSQHLREVLLFPVTRPDAVAEDD